MLLTSKAENYKEVFDSYDVEAQGFINTCDLADIIRNLGYNPTEEQMQEIIIIADEDGNGVIDFNEFLNVMANYPKQIASKSELVSIFEMFDTDGSGYISVDELKQLMTTLGEPLTEEDIEEIMQFADIDQDGQLNYEEFANLLLSETTKISTSTLQKVIFIELF